MSDDHKEVSDAPARATRGWYADTAALTGVVGLFLIIVGEWGWGAWLLVLAAVCTALWLRARRRTRLPSRSE